MRRRDNARKRDKVLRTKHYCTTRAANKSNSFAILIVVGEGLLLHRYRF